MVPPSRPVERSHDGGRFLPHGARASLTAHAPLAPLVWFKAGGAAEWLFEPQRRRRSARLPARPRSGDAGDGAGARLEPDRARRRRAGRRRAAGQGVRQGRRSSRPTRARAAAARAASSSPRPRATPGIAGLEFLRSIPGTVGGFVRMNGGAYGARGDATSWSSATWCCASGELVTLAGGELGYTYRHSELPEGAIVVAARFRGHAGRTRRDRGRDGPHRRRARGLAAAALARPAARPSRIRDGHKAWALIDRRRLPRADDRRRAGVSEKHYQLPAQPRRGDARPISRRWARRCAPA